VNEVHDEMRLSGLIKFLEDETGFRVQTISISNLPMKRVALVSWVQINKVN